MKTRIALLLSISLLYLAACEDEQPTHPKVQTDDATLISGSSFTAKGTIVTKGSIPILDYGFLYAQHESLEINSSFASKVSLGKDASNGTYEQTIVIPPKQDYWGNISRDYYVRAYLTNEKGTAYGVVKALTFPALMISDIVPMQAKEGDVITIKGSNFAPDPASNIVKFNNAVGTVKTASTTELTVQVPTGITFPYYYDNTITITVFVGTQQAQRQSFKILPSLTSFSPTSGTFGNVITISGSNCQGHSYSIKLGNVSVSAQSVTSSSISFVIPSNVTDATFPVSVLVDNSVLVELPGEFTITPPVIFAISPTTGIAGTLVTLTGSGYNTPDYYKTNNTVMFGSVKASLYEVTSGSIKAYVPAGLNVGERYNVTVSTGVHTVTAPSQFTMGSPSITDFTPKTASNSSYVTVTGTNFSNIAGEVLFGSAKGTVYSWTDTSIQVRVPSSSILPTGTYKITVNVGGQSAVSTESITIQ